MKFGDGNIDAYGDRMDESLGGSNARVSGATGDILLGGLGGLLGGLGEGINNLQDRNQMQFEADLQTGGFSTKSRGAETPKTGLAAFFCIYKLDSKGYKEKDATGQPILNMVKCIGFTLAGGVILYGIYKFFKGGRRSRRRR